MDRRGTLLLIGTPGNVLTGPFYEATCPTFKRNDRPIVRVYDDPQPFWTEKKRSRWPQWSFHTFNQKHNIHCPYLWEDAQRKKYNRGWPDDHPTWVREYLGQWVATGDEMVYALATLITLDGGVSECRAIYEPEFGNGFNKHGLPDKEEWNYVLGIDMGYEDDTAIVVVAYSDHLKTMYLVYEHKEKHMLPHQIADKINAIQRHFDGQIDNMVADTGNLSKMIIQEMNALNDFYLQPAEKRDKFGYIELLNADLYTGQIQVPYDSELAKEWLELTFDLKTSTKAQMAKAGKLAENRANDNHLADAMLYTWRFCYHHWARPVATPIDPFSEAAMLAWDRREAVKAAEKRDNPADFWYDDFLEKAEDEDPFDTSWLT